MNPIEIFAKSCHELSPSLIEYEVGSEVEFFLFKFLNIVNKLYTSFFVISFFDAFKAFSKYTTRVFGKPNVLDKCQTIPIFSKESDSLRGSIPIVLAEIKKNFEKLSNSLVIVLGLDFYSVIFGEEELTKLYPRLINLTYSSNTLIVLNTKLLSNRAIQIVDGFSATIAKLGVEEKEGKLMRYLVLLRTPFPEYNLRKWYFSIERGEILFHNSE